MKILTSLLLCCAIAGCESDLRVQTTNVGCTGPSCDPAVDVVPDAGPSTQSPIEDKQKQATKLSAENCLDPDLTKVPSGVFLTLCNGESAQGSLDLSLLSPQNIKSGITIGGVQGTAPLEAHVDCSADGAFGCVNDGVNFKAMAVAALQASNIRFGVSIAGVTGSVIEKPADCGADGLVGCVTTSSYKSADVNAIIDADLKSGKTIAGISGSVTNCSDGGAGCYVVGPTFVATASGNVLAGNIKSGVTIAGVAGTYGPACAADGAGSCLVDGSIYKAARLSNFSGANIESGITIAGVAGTATVENHTNCNTDGDTDCIATASYPAADASVAVAGNIRGGVTLAGVAGTYPSLATPLVGSSGAVNDLTTLAASTPAGNYEFFDSTGARHTGIISDAGTITAGQSDQSFTDSLYRQFTVVGDSDLSVANIKSGVSIFGFAGTVVSAPATCSSNAEVGCVTTATFKAADLSNLSAENIKNGVVLAGVTGDYPSALHPLTGANAGVADLPAFSATTGGASYEWFASDGTHLTGTIEADESVVPGIAAQTLNTGLYRSVTVNGDADLVASNIKTGVAIFGVTGNVTPSAADCSSNGEVGCVTTATFKAADLTNLVSGNIKNGVTIAGALGAYPSVASPLAGADGGVTDLTSLAATTAAGAYEFFDSTGARYTGNIADAGTIVPSTSSQDFNTALYRQFTVSGDSDLSALSHPQPAAPHTNGLVPTVRA